MSKSTIIQGIQFLSIELKKLGFCENINQLDEAIKSIQTAKPNQPWSYSIKDFPIFITGTSRNAIPTLESMTLYLSISFKEKPKNKDANTVSELIVESSFSLLIQGKKKDEEKYYYSGWHLDNDSSGTEFIHPQYHISFGGIDFKKRIGENTNNLLLLKSPRLPHPPLDVILSIDYILKHFIENDRHKELTESVSYQTYIKNSQRRIWQPYYTAIAKHWCPGCNLTVENQTENILYLPQLIK